MRARSCPARRPRSSSRRWRSPRGSSSWSRLGADRPGHRRASSRSSRRATSSSTAATPTSRTPGAGRRRCARRASTSSGPASPVARSVRSRARRSCRGLQGVVCVARAAARVDLGPGRRGAVLRLDGSGRRRSLRQDGPQRHRVRRHAVHRRGLRCAFGRRAVVPRLRGCVPRVERGDLDSFLVEITAEVLDQVDAPTGAPWWSASSTARSRRARSLDRADRPRARGARAVHRRGRLRALGVRRTPPSVTRADRSSPDPSGESAPTNGSAWSMFATPRWASKVVGYAQGLEMIREASETYD